MRTIKFRAWYGGRMVYDVAVIGGVAMHEVNPKGDCLVVGEDGTRGYTDWCKYEPMQDAILMQFTGLKDKNGVEIYEGDIVTMQCGAVLEYHDPEDWAGKSPFEDGYWTGEITTMPSTGVMLKKAFWKDSIEDSIEIRKPRQRFYSTKATRVVGNIHDNPEMMEGVQ